MIARVRRLLDRLERMVAHATGDPPDTITVHWTRRLTIALGFGAWGAFITYFALVVAPHHLAKDFSWPWRAARALLAGFDPYRVIQPTGPYPFNVGLFYPLPAVVAAIPFAPLRPEVAGALFFGLSSGLLAFGLTRNRDGFAKLPLFASAPFCMAAVLAQWSPLMVAAATLPALQFLTVTKPNIGAVAWIYRPTVRGAVAAAGFTLLTLMLLPAWPLEWREALRAAPRYKGPILRGITGAILLLGVLKWRRREGRLFLAMAALPQLSLFYDQLPLWLIPNTVWRSAALSALSWVAWWQWYPSRSLTSSVKAAEPWVFWLVYVPALTLLLLLPRASTPTEPRPPGSGSA